MFGSFYAYRSDSWTTWAGYDYDGLNSKVLLMKYLSKEFNQNWTGIHKNYTVYYSSGWSKRTRWRVFKLSANSNGKRHFIWRQSVSSVRRTSVLNLETRVWTRHKQSVKSWSCGAGFNWLQRAFFFQKCGVFQKQSMQQPLCLETCVLKKPIRKNTLHLIIVVKTIPFFRMNN